MKVSPFYMVRLLPNMAAHHVSCYFDTQGYTSTVVVACSSGTQAIGEATGDELVLFLTRWDGSLAHAVDQLTKDASFSQAMKVKLTVLGTLLCPAKQ